MIGDRVLGMDAEMDMGMDLENVIVIDLNMQAFLFTVLIMLFAEIYLGFKDTIGESHYEG